MWTGPFITAVVHYSHRSAAVACADLGPVAERAGVLAAARAAVVNARRRLARERRRAGARAPVPPHVCQHATPEEHSDTGILEQRSAWGLCSYYVCTSYYSLELE